MIAEVHRARIVAGEAGPTPRFLRQTMRGLEGAALDVLARHAIARTGADVTTWSDAECHDQLRVLLERGLVALEVDAPTFRSLRGWPEPTIPTAPPRDDPRPPVGPVFDDVEAAVDFIVVDDRGELCRDGHWRITTGYGEVGHGTTGSRGGAVRSVLPERAHAGVVVTDLRWWGARSTIDPESPRGPVLAHVEDVCFNHNSIVLLPTDQVGVAGGLEVIREVLAFVDVHPKRQVMVVGHTDASGGAAGNLALADARASAVHSLLRGERDSWAQACAGWSFKIDWRRILAWVAREFAWKCDPGPIDEQPRARADQALGRFRERWRLEGGEAIAGGPIVAADWRAFFGMYERWLAAALGCDTAELTRRRDAIAWASPPTLACGDAWPRMTGAHDDDAVAANRRVDVWLFEPHDVPSPGGAPPGVELYGEDTLYDPWPLSPGKPGPRMATQLRIVDRDDRPLVDARVHVSQGGVEQGVVVTDDDGHAPIELRPGGGPGGGPVEVSVEGYLLLPIHGADVNDVPRGWGGELVGDTPWGDWLRRVVALLDGAVKLMAFDEPTIGPADPDPADPVSPVTPDPNSPFGPDNPYRIDDLWNYWRHADTGEHIPLTADERQLQLESYRAHVRAAAKTRSFFGSLPPAALATIPSTDHKLRSDAAVAAGALLEAIRAALDDATLAEEPGASTILTIGICSGYRSSDQQFSLWNKRFYKYLWQYKVKLGDPARPAAEIPAAGLAKFIGGKTGAPGYSTHNAGRAIDLELRMAKGKRLGAGSPAKWRETWAHRWLVAHGVACGFVPYTPEPWHWEYPP